MTDSKNLPKISFGIIVLNGEPYTRYVIRTLYPHAHEIIIVEGACEGASFAATKHGHSSDGTLAVLHHMQKYEDPENKLVIVKAQDEGHENGFWPGEKDEQSRAYAKRATGDYLWQVDVDEFYKDEDIAAVKRMLAEDPTITAVSFIQKQFWGGFDFLVYGKRHQKGGEQYHRLFKWEDGSEYRSHRPPQVYNSTGIDTRSIHWIRGKQLAKRGIYLYHYSFVFPSQVLRKAAYYQNSEWSMIKEGEWWFQKIFMELEDPHKVHIYYWENSWLKRFGGEHPSQIRQMIRDIQNNKLIIEMRHTDDIENLLNSRYYNLKIILLMIYNFFSYKSVRLKIKCSRLFNQFRQKKREG